MNHERKDFLKMSEPSVDDFLKMFQPKTTSDPKNPIYTILRPNNYLLESGLNIIGQNISKRKSFNYIPEDERKESRNNLLDYELKTRNTYDVIDAKVEEGGSEENIILRIVPDNSLERREIRERFILGIEEDRERLYQITDKTKDDYLYVLFLKVPQSKMQEFCTLFTINEDTHPKKWHFGGKKTRRRTRAGTRVGTRRRKRAGTRAGRRQSKLRRRKTFRKRK